MFYYEVLPLKKTGSSDQVFTYESEIEMPLGVIVRVPLRNRSVRGIVTGKVSRPDFKTRPIDKILADEPVLSDHQLRLAKKISNYYFSSLGETINSFLPFDLGKKRRAISEKKAANSKQEKPHLATENQKEIIASIKKEKPGSTHLIHGVTGSGKTEIYLQLVDEALRSGKGSIILVPEISLTPQTLSRFEKRFPGQVAIWHSQLKETEKYHSWEKLQKGEKLIVLGARSAIFMPVKNLAYIIIDEEHEGSYKQDQNPKYQTDRVASWLAELTGAKVILGSATPKLESFYKAKNNEYFYYSMNKRIIQDSMPPIKIVDMRTEFRKGNKSIFSDELTASIKKNLSDRKQTLLFVNRRGASTFVVCRDCGEVEKCPMCDIPLIYHPNEGNKLICHHCDFKKNVPTVCPNCKSYAIKYFGLGTQRVEIEVKKMFPKAKIARMDRDTTKKRGSHEDIFTGFKNKDYDILIGTQIIAKGWDLPDVNLVGVIAADTTLNIPDYQSAEKTFSLMTQVAGRTGRSHHQGKVIIQTYNPDNYALNFAKKHDYLNFYDQEIKSRKSYKYPPFSIFVKLSYRSKEEYKAETKANLLAEKLKNQTLGKNIYVLGAAPAFIYKKGGFFHWHIILKVTGSQKSENKEGTIVELNKKLKETLPPDWIVDVEPGNII